MIEVAAPPPVSPLESTGIAARLLPLVMSVATLSVMTTALLSGSPVTRNPTFMAVPVMMLGSLAVAAMTARGRHRGLEDDRIDYLSYLSDLRRTVAETAAKQRSSLARTHPGPDTLWTLIGGPRMWERGSASADYCRVRVGVGTVPLATRLLAPQLPPVHRSDPVTVTALRQFLRAHSTIADAPIAIPLREAETVIIDGSTSRVRGLVRAMVCQLAVWHAPDRLLIAAVIDDRHRVHWEWLKWLPHNQHPGTSDAAGAARMVYPTVAEAESALAGVTTPLVVIVDDDERTESVRGATTIVVGAGGARAPVRVRRLGQDETLVRPDDMDVVDALVCARLLAAHRPDDARGFWCDRTGGDRLRVPIGTSADGKPVELDIKEPAAQGMGPHGLCIGATGSGKSELLRTIALGMMVRNSPEVVNLLLIDFKGGATFLDFGRAAHVAAVITNLAQEAPLVARMWDALAGEMHRRQQLLRSAGNFVSVADYERTRRSGAELRPLPTLFIIVDEFSELLSQHPDFADVFVAIGRLGRSLGMHLLLASQRLDEGRLRGLEAHLSYRLCLKTLSASESRAVLGTPDAYHLPNNPGAGILRAATGEMVRFQATCVSGQVQRSAPRAPAPAAVRLFSTHGTGIDAQTTGPTVLQKVLDRLCRQGPPAHPIWLPPLDDAPALADLLRDGGFAALSVPVGIVDRPFEQTRTPLLVDLSGSAGHLAVVGAPRAGKSTALRTLIMALAATHDPGQVQFYCLDFGGGSLASLGVLPHVGAVAGRAAPELARRMVGQLESILQAREVGSSEAPGRSEVFLVVDGWSALGGEFAALQESITALAAQGLAYGVHVVLSASRWAELRPALRDQIGTRIELRLGDPADSELDRKQARQVPGGKPGRGICQEGLHIMIARPELKGIGFRCGGGEVAPPIALLPAQVAYDDIVRGANEAGRGRDILLGLEERRLRPVSVDLGHHLLVLGDSGCGKTAALRTLCREIVRAGNAQLFLVDFRRGLLGVVEPDHLGGYAMSPQALGAVMPGVLKLLQARVLPPNASQAQLRERSWWSGPEIYVVVDDYDMITVANPLHDLLEYLPHATDLGLHVIVARRSGGAARALFEPLLAALRDGGCLGLMMSARPDEGTLLGAGRPRPLPPGRGVLVARNGTERLVQVAWCPP
ncbi:type VII secretion protein EccCb [Mycobacterium intermedium]|uniref:Type VII secretion protein EccCb n=1 Tax=Mycobacterium intermedium TaxID=28445 RepID=A0A1E3SMK5_MYCIE|nr:type VII secretion protein EccCb [Mycobacterium intermedium]MCV6963501.1 type VII secretion protein EccCb [Mycobacterium intermedium]ODR02873.1 type VII secretion protein EccCb [Mycobacterium intermedium]OPE47098.1 type VII secretion protein EccCb [Mycobacterium intermedium]ORB09524.1 type VII secretion protein EccCb [Mycobacterium intermedium]